MSTSLPAFALEVYFAKWEFAARHHLTASDAQTLTVGELLDLGGDERREQFEQLELTYVPTWGTHDLRQAIASTYERIGPEHVLAFAGAEEAMFWVVPELIGPDDHAIVTVPNYQSMETLAINTGAAIDGLLLRPEEQWALDLDRLQRLLRPNTRLIAVNFPNNPTGAIPDRETFAQLIQLCEASEIRLLSDEVYRGLELDSAATLPQAADSSGTAISMNVLSKAYGLPGLRIGWLATRDRALLERLERRKHYTTICNAGPSELLATIALEHGDAIKARNRAIIATNLPHFDAFFADHVRLFEWEPPAGGCVCFPRYGGADGVEAFCRDAVERAGVLLLPASIYRSNLATVAPDRFRVGVGRRDAPAGLKALGEFVGAREPVPNP